MAKKLTSNVHVNGAWYGPSYPEAKVTAEVLEQITNPAAFAEEGSSFPEPAPGPGSPPASPSGAVGERAELESMSQEDLAALAKARGVDSGGSKAKLVDRLSART